MQGNLREKCLFGRKVKELTKVVSQRRGVVSPGLLTSVLIRLFMAFKSAALQEKNKNTIAFESFLLTSENKEEKAQY